MDGTTDEHWCHHIRRWRFWADRQSEASLPTADRPMCQGPNPVVKEFARANIKGVIFACEKLEDNKKAKDSFIVTLRDPTEEDKRCGGVDVGRVQRFIQHEDPCEPGKVWEIIDAKWFKLPPEGKDWNPAINCPVVLQTFSTVAETGGNLWPLSSIAPTKVALVPHIENKPTGRGNRWQVLHVDSYLMSSMAGCMPCQPICK